ncbi:hypothetical protein Tco_0299669 [Tanacetum coccineum]
MIATLLTAGPYMESSPLDRDLQRHQPHLLKAYNTNKLLQGQALDADPNHRITMWSDQSGQRPRRLQRLLGLEYIHFGNGSQEPCSSRSNRLNRQRASSNNLDRDPGRCSLRDDMRVYVLSMASDTTTKWRLSGVPLHLIDTFWQHTVTVTGEEMKRLEATGEYTEDRSNGWQRGKVDIMMSLFKATNKYTDMLERGEDLSRCLLSGIGGVEMTRRVANMKDDDGEG